MIAFSNAGPSEMAARHVVTELIMDPVHIETQATVTALGNQLLNNVDAVTSKQYHDSSAKLKDLNAEINNQIALADSYEAYRYSMHTDLNHMALTVLGLSAACLLLLFITAPVKQR